MMGYFPNSTAWECWAPDNCFKCSHWPKDEDGPPCPVEAAHMLFNYDQAEGSQVESIMTMLIPRSKDGLGNGRCAMFKDKDGLSLKHLRDWEKYKTLMAERDAARVIEVTAIGDRNPSGPRREAGSGRKPESAGAGTAIAHPTPEVQS